MGVAEVHCSICSYITTIHTSLPAAGLKLNAQRFYSYKLKFLAWFCSKLEVSRHVASGH